MIDEQGLLIVEGTFWAWCAPKTGLFFFHCDGLLEGTINSHSPQREGRLAPEPNRVLLRPVYQCHNKHFDHRKHVGRFVGIPLERFLIHVRRAV